MQGTLSLGSPRKSTCPSVSCSSAAQTEGFGGAPATPVLLPFSGVWRGWTDVPSSINHAFLGASYSSTGGGRPFSLRAWPRGPPLGPNIIVRGPPRIFGRVLTGDVLPIMVNVVAIPLLPPVKVKAVGAVEGPQVSEPDMCQQPVIREIAIPLQPMEKCRAGPHRLRLVLVNFEEDVGPLTVRSGRVRLGIACSRVSSGLCPRAR